MVDEATIRSAAQTLVEHASSSARVVLFGSRARGDHDDDSDIDFLVIEEVVESRMREMVRLRRALPALGVPVDVIVMSRRDAERGRERPGSLAAKALAEGRDIT